MWTGQTDYCKGIGEGIFSTSNCSAGHTIVEAKVFLLFPTKSSLLVAIDFQLKVHYCQIVNELKRAP